MARTDKGPIVGVAALVPRRSNGTDLLVGRRLKPGRGNGRISPPGGHVEHGETWRQAIARELLEKSGLVVDPFDILFLGITNDVHDDGFHYLTIFGMCAEYEGEPANKEPEKTAPWEWMDWASLALRDDLFLPFKTYLTSDFWQPEFGLVV